MNREALRIVIHVLFIVYMLIGICCLCHINGYDFNLIQFIGEWGISPLGEYSRSAEFPINIEEQEFLINIEEQEFLEKYKKAKEPEKEGEQIELYTLINYNVLSVLVITFMLVLIYNGGN